MRYLTITSKILALTSCFNLALLLASLPVTLSAQTTENCSNGIDDDGDQLIDFYDPDCPCDTAGCGKPFLNICADNCSPGQTGAGLNPVLKWSTPGIVNAYTPMVGDVDGDCIPDIVGVKPGFSAIHIVDTKSGKIKDTIILALHNHSQIALGNVDSDPEMEIFANARPVSFSSNYRIIRFDYDTATGDFKQTWISSANLPRNYAPGLADFNEDGQPEIYAGNRIINSQTGLELAKAPGSQIGVYPTPGQFLTSTATAVDALPPSQCQDCSGLELVAGNMVYSVKLFSMTDPSANVVDTAVMGPHTDGLTRIVDFDRDGDLDAVVVHRSWGVSAKPYLYIWDLQTPNQIGKHLKLAKKYLGTAGAPTIVDIDNDGWPEIIIASVVRLSLLKDYQSGGGQNWGQSFGSVADTVIKTHDYSGVTGATAFDFDGDGIMEVVYRDEKFLKFMDNRLKPFKQFNCISGTASEYPVIADIDADGSAEMIITCSNKIYAYHSGDRPWVGARSVWNQYNYFGVNVNDDGTIPRQQQLHHIVRDSVMMNNCNIQQPLRDTSGRAINSYPDLVTKIWADSCDYPYTWLKISVCNSGTKTMTGGIPVTVYIGNAGSAAANKYQSVVLPNSIPVGACDTIRMKIASINNAFIAAASDTGSATTTFVPSPFAKANQYECDYVDNQDSTAISCQTPELLKIQVRDVSCYGGHDGSAKVISTDTTIDITYSLNGFSNTSGSFDSLLAGSYVATLTDSIGFTDTVHIHVMQPSPIISNVNQIQDEICLGDEDGKLNVMASGGTPPFQFTLDTIMNSNGLFTQVAPGWYSILIEDANGCERIEQVEILPGTRPQAAMTFEYDPCQYPWDVEFQNQSSQFTSSTWYFADGDSSTSENARHRYYSAGARKGYMVATDARGCKDTSTFAFQFYDLPQARFHSVPAFQTYIEPNELVTFFAHDTNGVKWHWSFSEGPDELGEVAFHSFERASVRCVKLIVENLEGCKAESELCYEIGASSIFIPNAFTPNDDNLNDFFEIVTKYQLQNFRVLIFDRWGKKVFESHDPHFRWDGRFQGENLPEGAFVYRVKAEMTSGVEIDEKGSVTILR